MSYQRATLAVTIHLALLSGVVHAEESIRSFPAYVDGHLVPTEDGEVYHEADQLDDDVKQAAATYCAKNTSAHSRVTPCATFLAQRAS